MGRDLKVKVNQAGDFSATGDDLRSVLRREYGVEAGIFTWPGIGSFIRLSYAVYNTPEDIDNLETAVLDVLKKQGGRVGRAIADVTATVVVADVLGTNRSSKLGPRGR